MNKKTKNITVIASCLVMFFGLAIPPQSSIAEEIVVSGNGAGSITSSEQAVAAAVSTLPVTGDNWFFIALIGNLMMMLLGGYLRLHSGRSPGFTSVS